MLSMRCKTGTCNNYL